MNEPNPNLESDPRFPSGKWVGFWTDRRDPGKHPMEMFLNFAAGRVTGSGRDKVEDFTIDGEYRIDDGRCDFLKSYGGEKKHSVVYRGFNEGRGIWGTWELSFAGQTVTGGFHIWPEGVPDPTGHTLKEEADLYRDVEAGDRVPVGV